jgi:hypothetical protein
MKIDCSQFERLWNECLDAREAVSPPRLRALEEHAGRCPSCRALAAGYQLLERALRSWGPGPSPPNGFAERVLQAREPEPVIVGRLRWRWAAAAALLVAVLVGLRLAGHPRGPGNPPDPIAGRGAARPDAPRPLADALADATLATLDLARETSAPAARIGRQVLASAAVSPGPPLSIPAPIEPAADVLQSVGDGVNQGVRPVAGSARHAFRFLLGPALRTPPAPARDRGA